MNVLIAASGYSAGSAKAKALCEAKKMVIASVEGQANILGATTAKCDHKPVTNNAPIATIIC